MDRLFDLDCEWHGVVNQVHTTVYPLRTMFQRRVLPWLLLCTALLVGATAWGGRYIVVNLYLEQAGRDAHTLVETLRREGNRAAAAWLQRFEAPNTAPLSADDIRQVGDVLDSVVSDRALPKLKIYDTQGIIRYSSAHAEIGRVERGVGMDEVLRTHGRTAVRVDTPEGAQFELYVYLPPADRQPAMVIEVYEPSTFLDDTLKKTLIPAALLPTLTLLAITWLLNQMVGKAQRQLDTQRAEVEGLQGRLEKLVSNRAADAARQGLPSLAEGHVMDVTLYYADVRDFTSYAETHRAEQVVQLLNRIVSIQVAEIDRFGGDVDKIIGDAVLAVFTGDDRATRAIACAQRVLAQCTRQPDLPRRLALGVHDGVVVAGTIGAPDRQDYTVIGDAVNVSQRICTLAGADELLADTRTLQRAGHPDGFGTVEEHTVKGRAEPLRIRRWMLAAPEAAPPIN